jgi:hypothetical protein
MAECQLAAANKRIQLYSIEPAFTSAVPDIKSFHSGLV